MGGRGRNNQSGAGRGKTQNNAGPGRESAGGRRGPAPVTVPETPVWGARAPAPTQSPSGRQPTPAAAPTQPRADAPPPAQSAWGRPAPVAAPATPSPSSSAQSAWGRPAPVAAPATPSPSSSAQSAWGRPAPVAAPATPSPSSSAQSAWGRPAPVAAPATPSPSSSAQPAWGRQTTPAAAAAPSPSSGRDRPVPASGPNGQRSVGGGCIARNRDQPPPSRQPQGAPRQQREPRTYVGHRGSTEQSNRGSTRDGKPVYSDIVVTRSADVKKKGTTGRVVPLTTNYFRLIKKPNWQIYLYRVDFCPPIENQRFMKKLIHDHRALLGNSGYLFDGTILLLSQKLFDDETEMMAKDRDESPIQIKVKFVKLVSMLNAEAIQTLNLILRRSMGALNLQLVGRNFFDAVAKITMPAFNLQLWPGYNTSIRQHETDILLCAQVATKVMRTETIYQIMRGYIGSRNFKDDFTNAVLGMTVLTDFNNKTYRIDDVTFDITPADTFDYKGVDTSFIAYYQTKHQVTIHDPGQPMLITKSSKRSIRGGQPEHILLVPELCRATGFTDNMRNNRKLMDEVAKYTRLGPRERISKLHAFNQRLQKTPASVDNFAEWNFQLDQNLVQVNGRQLPQEIIYFGSQKQAATDDWSRLFHNHPMYAQVPLKNWVVIAPSGKGGQARDFVGVLQDAASRLRYEIQNPHWIDIPDDFSRTYSEAIERAGNHNPQLIMCILNGLNAEKYSTIKKKCYVQRGVMSQVMLGKTITPRPGRDKGSLMTVGTKVAIQINAKLGGAPWMVNIPLSKVMVVGFDVCHDTNDKSKSYGALVATMDMKESASYFSTVSPHKNGEELCNAFAINMAKAVSCYGAKHGLPDRIFIYRDGVGEGQTDYVREHEIKAIQNQLNQLYKGNAYKLIFIVVSKRINTRFFAGDVNPNPGTVVDDVVTLPERHDFYLISQKAGQGTVSPTNYNILFNTSGLDSDLIQRFTHKMTHLYYNWTSTLAVPAVCQYAHKLAFLVGNFIHQAPSAAVEKQLYFL